METCTSERSIDKHATHRSWLERRQWSFSTIWSTIWFTGSHMPNVLSETTDPTDISDGKDDDDDNDEYNDNITEVKSEDDDDSDVD